MLPPPWRPALGCRACCVRCAPRSRDWCCRSSDWRVSPGRLWFGRLPPPLFTSDQPSPLPPCCCQLPPSSRRYTLPSRPAYTLLLPEPLAKVVFPTCVACRLRPPGPLTDVLLPPQR